MLGRFDFQRKEHMKNRADNVTWEVFQSQLNKMKEGRNKLSVQIYKDETDTSDSINLDYFNILGNFYHN